MREDHARNHERLLEAALELFDEQGFEVSLRQVAERSGVSQAGLFRHFSGREQLILEAYEYAAHQLTVVALASLTKTENEPVARQLDSLLEQLTTQAAKHSSYAQLAAFGMRLNPSRPVDPDLALRLGVLMSDAKAVGLIADDVTGFDIVNSTVVAAGLLSGPAPTAVMGRRMLAILRRGFSPESQEVCDLPPMPRAPHT